MTFILLLIAGSPWVFILWHLIQARIGEEQAHKRKQFQKRLWELKWTNSKTK